MSKEETMADPKTVETILKWLNELYTICKKIADVISKVPKDVEVIKGDLNRVQALIVAVAAAREELTGEEVRQVKHMKEAIFTMEDIIYDYESPSGWEFEDLGCAALPHETAELVKSVFLRLDIARRIYLIKSKVQRIEATQEKKRTDAASKREPSLLDTVSSSSKGNPDSSWQYLRRLPEQIKDTQVVGLTDHCAQLIRLLEHGRDECTVITLVGTGGAGKTTLARRVFNNDEVTSLFPCRAWITVSQFENNIEGMLEDMLKQFCPQNHLLQLTSTTIGGRLKEYLKDKRYVVFFDEVWRENFWEGISSALDDNNCRSRIIITSRNKKVKGGCKKSLSVKVEELEMQPLSRADSFKLFNDIAFRNSDNPTIHQHISSAIIEKCMHSPLGIVAIAREIAADDNFPREWQNHVKRNADIAKILSFSYDDLPEHLKPCLLYFGLYPENHQVKSKRIIRQWIAEGFVKSEEVARDYLEELIDRCLVQMSSSTFDGKAKSCRVHYLVRVMILQKIEDLRFCQFINEDNMLEKEDIIRRLSITTRYQGRLDASFDGSKIYSFMRSLLFFPQQEFDVSEYTTRIIFPAKSTQLKVLDFEGALLCKVPEIIGISIKLKYLSFRNTKVEILPNSIGLLLNLETLDLRQTGVTVIPNEVSKLKKLRHLLGTDISLMQLKDGVKEMKSLQTVKSARVEEDGGLIKELAELKEIRDLGLTNVMDKHKGALCISLNKMPKLWKLHVIAKDENEINLQNLSARNELQKIHLHGKLSSLPGCILQLQKLYKLVLSKSKLTDDPLLLLKNVFSLRFLSIIDEGYVGPSLHFQVGGFNYLEELELGSLYGLNSIIVDSNALQSLNKLNLRNIPQLNMVPPGIQHLGKLKDFNIESMSAEFVRSFAVNEENSITKQGLRVSIDGRLLKDMKP